MTTTIKHINQLIDAALKTIFDELPLEDLLRTTRVCRRWAFIHSWACRTRRTLTLVIGQTDKATKQILESTFRIDNGDTDDQLLYTLAYSRMDIKKLNGNNGIAHLAATFPRVTKLQLAFSLKTSQKRTLLELTEFLRQLGHQLSMLKVWGEINDSCEANNDLLKFILALNGQSKLKHLTIELQNCLFASFMEARFQLPILGHLHEFCFYSRDTVAIFAPIVAESYTMANKNLRQIAIHNTIEHFFSDENNPHFIEKTEVILPKLTSAQLVTWQVEYFYSLLTGLKNLRVFLSKEYDENLMSLFTALAKLDTIVMLYFRLANSMPIGLTETRPSFQESIWNYPVIDAPKLLAEYSRHGPLQ